jgi:hypothetical protein
MKEGGGHLISRIGWKGELRENDGKCDKVE